MFYNPVTFFANLSDSFQGALASTEKILDILEEYGLSVIELGLQSVDELVLFYR